MERFKERIRIRTIWMSLVTIGLAAAYFILLMSQDYLPEIPDFIRGFQTGAFAGVFIILVFFMVRYMASMKDENALKKLYIEENDERRVMIMQKTGAMGMSICSIGLAIGAVIAGFFDQTVFFSLLGATAFTALVRGLFKLYYYRKF